MNTTWQTETVEHLSHYFQRDSDVRAFILTGSLADDDVQADVWSDVDAKVILADHAVSRYYTSTAWLEPLGRVIGFEKHENQLTRTLRALLESFQRLDFVFIAESTLQDAPHLLQQPCKVLWSRLPDLEAHIAPRSVSEFHDVANADIARMADSFWFKASVAITKVARNDLLIAAHLAMDLARDCLVLQMMRRDQEKHTTVHRTGGWGNGLVGGLPWDNQKPSAQSTLDLIQWSCETFDTLAADLAPDYQPRAPYLTSALDLARSTRESPHNAQRTTRNPTTESRNPATTDIDAVATLEMVRLINAEDAKVALTVETQLARIGEAIDGITARMREGGRLIYVGAGTSGRLGVLDASECPPTFNTAPEQVIGLMAGGYAALTTAGEGAEDDREAGVRDIVALNITIQDSVVGIASSGSTPYVLGAMVEARERGALVVGLTCNSPAPVEALADVAIAPIVGPEAITGSTRLKAGTAQKMVLNMLSTGVMIRLGKTYGNLMVDVRASNEKLRKRALRIVMQAVSESRITNYAGDCRSHRVTEEEVERALTACNGEVKTAIVALVNGISPKEARQKLASADGVVRRALEEL